MAVCETITVKGKCEECGAPLTPRRPLIDQILKPEFTPAMALKVINRLENLVEDLLLTVEAAR